jgi:hypothetical protein
MRIRIPRDFLSDPRITRLAQRLGHADEDTTRGKLLRVFGLCCERRSMHASRDDLESICPGMADALIDPLIDFGFQEPEGIHIRGMRTRVDAYPRHVDAGRKGGIASGESRRSAALDRKSSQTRTGSIKRRSMTKPEGG